MDTTLVVLAAGIGARYGAGIKQLERMGPNGEVIMDYSVHDAVRAGFNRLVFVIRRDIYEDFQSVIGRRLERELQALGVRVDYAFQELTDPPAGRVKPWGTGHAILCCRELLDSPFAVINADDYYGREAFPKAHDFLAVETREPDRYGMIGFVLKNTLSDAGGVTRGVCHMDENGYLTDITETRNIVRTAEGAAVMSAEGQRPLDGESLVSMNMWMLTPTFVKRLESGFAAFRAHMTDPWKDEYLLPEIIGELLRDHEATVKVLPTGDQWFGITYQADRAPVKAAFQALIDRGVYRPDLFSDLR